MPRWSTVFALGTIGACTPPTNAVEPAPDVRSLDGGVAPRSRAADRVIGLANAGGAFCVTHASGAVRCWGDLAPLGLEPAEGSFKPVLVAGASGVAKVVYSSPTLCILRRRGSAACRRPPLGDSPPAWIELPGVQDAVDLVGSEGFVCARLRSGEVACAPNPYLAPALRNGVEVKLVPGLTQVEELTLGEESNFAGAALSGTGCARRSSGGAACFRVAISAGFDVSPAKPAPAPRTPRRLPGPSPVPALDDVVEVVSDRTQTSSCALRTSGEVWCWGDNAHGILGQPTTLKYAPEHASPVVDLTDAVDLAISPSAACATRSDRTAVCWGRIPGGNEEQARPTRVRALDGDVTLLGGDHICARTKAGAITCPDGSRGPARPELVTAAGMTCERSATGRIMCQGERWPRDGDVAGGVYREPHDVFGAEGFTELALGPSSLCARRGVGAFECRSRNPDTIGTPPDGAALAALGSVKKLALGHVHFCAIREDHTVFCGGPPGSLLGDGSVLASKTPVRVGGL